MLKDRRQYRPHALTLAVLAALGLGAGCTNPHTPAGHEGYVFEQPRVFGEGGFRGAITGPGNYGVSLWNNQVTNIDVRPQTFSEEFRILAKDDLNVAFRIHAVLRVTKGQVRTVVESYGGEAWYARFVKEPFRTFVRQEVQAYTSQDLKAKRADLGATIRTKLEAYLGDSPMEVVNLSVGNIDYPDIVAQAVEKKLAARQLLAEKETQKEIAQKDAEIRIEEARGIAQAQRIINSTLSANYLQHEAIAAQKTMAASPNHTTVYIPVGSNGIPMVYQPR